MSTSTTLDSNNNSDRSDIFSKNPNMNLSSSFISNQSSNQSTNQNTNQSSDQRSNSIYSLTDMSEPITETITEPMTEPMTGQITESANEHEIIINSNSAKQLVAEIQKINQLSDKEKNKEDILINNRSDYAQSVHLIDEAIKLLKNDNKAKEKLMSLSALF